MPTLTIKAYIEAAAAILLILLFVWWTVHERNQATAAVRAADQRVVLVAQAKDVAIAAAAQASITAGTQIYEKVVALPPVGDLGVVCQSPRTHAVPGPAKPDLAGHNGPDGVQGDVFDPSGDLLTHARSEAALVRGLQAEIAALHTEMAAAHESHQ